jgi:lysophospholipase L1-like esterase
MNKRLFLSPLLWVALKSLALAGGTITWPTPPPPPDANTATTVQSPISGWLNSFEQNLQNSRKMGKIDLIFDGDQWAITSGNYGPTGGMWDRYGKLNAFDFSNRSDTTQSLLWRLQNGQVDGLDPKLIVLEIGANNINTNTPEQIAEGIKADISEYQKRCPHAVILLQGLWPHGEKPTDPSRAKVKALNQLISSLGDGKKVIYLDFGDKFLQPDGTINSGTLIYFSYPTGTGYKIWGDAIQPIITQYIPQSTAASTPAAASPSTTGTTQLAGTVASAAPIIGGGTVTWPSAPVPPGGNSAIIPEPPLGWLDQFQKKIDEAHKMPRVDLLFDGDSITAGWKGGGGGIWGHKYAKLNAYDFGNPGDTTGGLIWQVGTGGQVDGLHPKLIVLLIGTNNLGHATAEQIAEGIKAVVTEYQKHCPGSAILLQGIFPRGAKPTDPARDKIKSINKIISQYADGKTILYLDFGDKFLQPDGSITKDIMPDFLHPSAKGYQIWADAIQPVIDQFFPPASTAPAPANPPKT